MIELYGSATPNVMKITIMLEEVGLPYRKRPVNVWKGEQYADDFIRLNPNSKVPVIVDEEADFYPVFESAAILIYLAEKTGRFLPTSGKARSDVLQWLMVQTASIGPMSGQFMHFEVYAGPGHDYAHSRYLTELKRLYALMDQRLTGTGYLGGEEFSIADIAVYPWVAALAKRQAGRIGFMDMASDIHPNLARWFARCAERPGVQRGAESHATFKSQVATAEPDDLDRIFGRGHFAYSPQ